MILPQAWHSEMVFLRNEVSFTCECFNINMQWSQVTRKECSEVGKQRLRGRGTLGDLTCWMRTSFSSFITLVKSSIWFDSCFVLIPKRNEKRCIFADGLKKKSCYLVYTTLRFCKLWISVKVWAKLQVQVKSLCLQHKTRVLDLQFGFLIITFCQYPIRYIV